MPDKIGEYIDVNRELFLEQLIELLKFPSVSSLSEHRIDMLDCAGWLKRHMGEIGLERCEVYPTAGHPVIYADWLHAPGAPTMLIYGHYDVQPVDPLDLWDSPPFEPVIKGEHIYARGAVDDKGQFFAHLKAVETRLKTSGSLPLNVKFIIEGEEEVGSANLDTFMKEHKELLSADLVVISDTPMFDYNMPSICYGLRGLAYMEVTIEGPKKDLHSGSFGGVIANPIEVLTKIVAQLKDDKNHITIPGFYDKVLELTDMEKENIRKLPFNQEAYLKDIGAEALTGEEGFTTLERAWARPTLDPNGIIGGFTGEGAKTVIPAWAKCKISMRLVPNQDADKIAQLFDKYVKSICPPTVRCKIQQHHGGNPFIVPLKSDKIRATARALKRGFQVDPVFTREGGSIPIVAAFKEILGLDAVLLSLGLPDENAHSPNEKFYLPNFFRGILSSAYLMEELAKK